MLVVDINTVVSRNHTLMCIMFSTVRNQKGVLAQGTDSHMYLYRMKFKFCGGLNHGHNFKYLETTAGSPLRMNMRTASQVFVWSLCHHLGDLALGSTRRDS